MSYKSFPRGQTYPTSPRINEPTVTPVWSGSLVIFFYYVAEISWVFFKLNAVEEFYSTTTVYYYYYVKWGERNVWGGKRWFLKLWGGETLNCIRKIAFPTCIHPLTLQQDYSRDLYL